MTTDRLTVLLVGASSEIGGAIIDTLLRDGPGTAVLAGRPGAGRTEAVVRLREAGHEVTELDYDAQFGEVETADLIRHAMAVTGSLDAVLVAVGSMGAVPEPAPRGAGDPPFAVSAVSPVSPVSPAEPDLQNLLLTNLVGPALVANAAATALSAQGRGVLLVVTSAAAIRPRQQILGYSCAKQALDSFVRGLDRRTMGHGARCMVVRPGRVRTRMTVGLAPAPLTTDPGHVAGRVRAALRSPRAVVWSPRLMGPATTVLARIPSAALPRGLR